MKTIFTKSALLLLVGTSTFFGLNETSILEIYIEKIPGVLTKYFNSLFFNNSASQQVVDNSIIIAEQINKIENIITNSSNVNIFNSILDIYKKHAVSKYLVCTPLIFLAYISFLKFFKRELVSGLDRILGLADTIKLSAVIAAPIAFQIEELEGVIENMAELNNTLQGLNFASVEESLVKLKETLFNEANATLLNQRELELKLHNRAEAAGRLFSNEQRSLIQVLSERHIANMNAFGTLSIIDFCAIARK